MMGFQKESPFPGTSLKRFHVKFQGCKCVCFHSHLNKESIEGFSCDWISKRNDSSKLLTLRCKLALGVFGDCFRDHKENKRLSQQYITNKNRWSG